MQEIEVAIEEYANASARLETLQKQGKLPRGEQKTCVIGVYYALHYLQAKFPNAVVKYAPFGTKGYDLVMTEGNGVLRKVQVKTVSAYSPTQTLSPIHHDWDELLVIRLDEAFKPVGFWRTTDNPIPRGKRVVSQKCPQLTTTSTRQSSLPLGNNLITDFREILSDVTPSLVNVYRTDSTQNPYQVQVGRN
jgi:hypothetical protein